MQRLLFFLLFFLNGIANAQKPAKRVLRSPNDFQGIGAILNLKNGKKLEGTIGIDFTKLHEEVSYRPDEGKERTFPVEDVISYDINDRVFLLCDMDTAGSGLKFNRRFCLRSSETFNSLVLYQLDYLASDLVIPLASPFINTSKMYFVMVPALSKNKIIYTLGPKLVPDFDTKVAIALKKLLPLSTKIAMKDKGYFYDQTTPVNMVARIWKTIVEEYNASN